METGGRETGGREQRSRKENGEREMAKGVKSLKADYFFFLGIDKLSQGLFFNSFAICTICPT